MHGHAQALGNIGDRFAFFGYLLDRFDLEFFGVTLATHGTSYLGLIMRLGGVYETRGDLIILPATYNIGRSTPYVYYRSVLADTTKTPIRNLQSHIALDQQMSLGTAYRKSEAEEPFQLKGNGVFTTMHFPRRMNHDAVGVK
ncbi:hypothetical protein AB1J88_05760 [Pseudomonas sp. S8]|uniref:hypothetical protein n=1 Tax=Pseudomonas sp. S8 TaxID=211136 RepID=UPI003D2846B7